MSERNNPSAPADPSRRRQMVAGFGIALGSLAAGSALWAKSPQTAKEVGGKVPSQTRTSLHQEVAFTPGPQRVYEVLLDSKQFAAFTGLPAEIDPNVGGAFKMFGGRIVGRNVELVPDKRIVQAWRPTNWDPGVYSIVKFELKPQGFGTLVVLDHTGFPESDFDGLSSGWPERYWEPLRKFFA